MNRKYLIIVSLGALLLIILLFSRIPQGRQAKTEELEPVSQAPEISNYNPPPEIKFNSSTDLKKELESVNPQVLDGDFESLNIK